VRRPQRLLRFLAAVIAVVVLVWCAATAGLYAAMRQPPERFGAIMSRVPGIAMMVLPFKPLWFSARSGHLQVGDPAPDFTLPMLHSDEKLTLSDAYRQRPVVLVFGSYT
jgi:hypothetical protein